MMLYITRFFGLILTCVCIYGCSGHAEEESCLYYENASTSGVSYDYIVNNNNFSKGLDYCAHSTYGRDGVVIRDEQVINDGLCQRILDASQSLDYDSVYASTNHALWLHDGEKFLIKGNVDPEKIKPILDLLKEECPNFGVQANRAN